MPVTTTYPGVYLEELPSGVRPLVGVATSITAFVGWSPRGPENDAIRIQSFGDYQRRFGDLESHALRGGVSERRERAYRHERLSRRYGGPGCRAENRPG